ncbi:MAG: hypothetical protein NTY53_23335, partial [Kiritimatiellaeota bacterium]|nr:hypothetical protein [Kiritimatiellota bacterium]
PAQDATIPSPSQRNPIPEEMRRQIRVLPENIGELIADLWHVNQGNRDWARDRLVVIGHAAIPALVAALKEESYEEIDKNLPPRVRQEHPVMMARHYYVQHTASEALAGITGTNWGFVFNEDCATWATWLATTNRQAFNPASIPRTASARRDLIRMLVHRYMSGRPNPWQPSNDLENKAAVVAIAHDLQQLRVEPSALQEIANDVCTTIPTWRNKIGKWLDEMLKQMNPKDTIQK